MSFAESFENDFLKTRKKCQQTFLKIDGVEEFADFVKKCVSKLDFTVDHHENKKSSHEELKKSLKNKDNTSFMITTKASKTIRLGSRFSHVWKLSVLASIIIALYYLLFSTPAGFAMLRNAFVISLGVALAAYSIKNNITISVWIKAFGVHDPKKDEGVASLVIAGEPDKQNSIAQYHLDEGFAELEQNFSNSYIKMHGLNHLVRQVSKDEVDIGLKKTESELRLLNESLQGASHNLEKKPEELESLEDKHLAFKLSKEFLAL